MKFFSEETTESEYQQISVALYFAYFIASAVIFVTLPVDTGFIESTGYALLGAIGLCFMPALFSLSLPIRAPFRIALFILLFTISTIFITQQILLGRIDFSSTSSEGGRLER